MYSFPKIRLPEGAVAEAERRGIPPDTFYCLELLDKTGISAVPGSGFGQAPNTLHFRTTILPSEEDMKLMLKSFQSFHASFMDKFRTDKIAAHL